MSDSGSNRSDSALDQEFLFYLSLADKLVGHEDLKRCQKWFEKLCSKLYTSREAKKRRNNYLIRLLIALHRNRLETPSDHSPPAGVLSSPEEVFPEEMPETEGADVFSDRTDSTYTVSKPLYIQGDVCGSVDTSIQKERNAELEDNAFQNSKIESSASESRIFSDRSGEISEKSAESTKTRVKIRRKITRKRSKSVPSKLLVDTSKKLRGGTSDLTAEYCASGERRAKNLVPNFFEYTLPTYFDEPQLAAQRERHFKNDLEYECSGRKVGDADETKILDEQASDEVKKALFLSQSTTNKSACETNNGDSQSMTSLKLPENLKIVSNKRVFHELGDQFPHPSGVSDQGESSCDRGTDLTRLLKTVGVCDGLFLSVTASDQTSDIQKSTDCETQLTSNRLDETNPLKNDLLYDERREEFASVRKDLFEPIRNLAGGYDGPFVAREDTLFAENWSSKNRTVSCL